MGTKSPSQPSSLAARRRVQADSPVRAFVASAGAPASAAAVASGASSSSASARVPAAGYPQLARGASTVEVQGMPPQSLMPTGGAEATERAGAPRASAAAAGAVGRGVDGGGSSLAGVHLPRGFDADDSVFQGSPAALGDSLIVSPASGQNLTWHLDGSLDAERALGDAEHRSPMSADDRALVDFEFRINQLQHLQVSYLTDQFAQLRHECTEFRSELKSVCLALEHVQATRELKEEALRCEVEEVREGAKRAAKQKDDQYAEVQQGLFDLHRALQEEAAARERAGMEQLRRLEDVRGYTETQTRGLQLLADKLSHGLDDLRHSVQLEASDRGDAEVRLEQRLEDVRRGIRLQGESSSKECAELHRQLLSLRSDCVLEQSERTNAGAELATAIKEVRSMVQSEGRQRAGDIATVLTQVKQLGSTMEKEQEAWQLAASDLSHKLGIAMDTIHEEQGLRASEDAELSTTLEACKRALLEEDGRRKALEASLRALGNEVRDLCEKETSLRKADVKRLEHQVAEQHEAILEQKRDVTAQLRAHEQRLDSLATNLKAEKAERTAMAVDMKDHVHETRCQTMDEHTQRHADLLDEMTTGREAMAQEFREALNRERTARQGHEGHVGTLTERLAQLQSSVSQEQQERLRLEGEVSTALRELRESAEVASQFAIGRESAAREEAHTALSGSIATIRQSLELQLQEQKEELLRRQRAEQGPARALSEVKEELEQLQHGVKKVAESVQFERQARHEGDEQLKEAVQHETSARLKLDGRLREAIKAEARTREEVVQIIQHAIEECRLGLETHTHEMSLEDGPATPSVAGSLAAGLSFAAVGVPAGFGMQGPLSSLRAAAG